MPPSNQQPDGLKIGRDKVTFVGELVVIHARREMADWQVREFCRVPIHFQDRKYYLSEKGPAERPYAFCYVLAPWPANLHEESKLSIVYDAEYVAERDGVARTDQAAEVSRLALLLIYPMLGFLWSGTKRRLAEHLGIIARRSTSASLFFEAFLLALYAVLWSWSGGFATVLFGLFGGGSFGAWTFGTAFFHLVVLGILCWDWVMRLDGLLREDVAYPIGFFEWLRRFRCKSKNGASPDGQP